MIVLETRRLRLRTWQDDDIDPMTAINEDPKVCEFLPSLGNRTMTVAVIKRFKDHFNTHGFCLYTVELKATNEFLVLWD